MFNCNELLLYDILSITITNTLKLGISQLPHTVGQCDSAPDTTSHVVHLLCAYSQPMQACAESLLLLAEVNISLDCCNDLADYVME